MEVCRASWGAKRDALISYVICTEQKRGQQAVLSDITKKLNGSNLY